MHNAAWDRRDAGRVLTAVLHTGVVPSAFCDGFVNLMRNSPGQIKWLSGMPYDHARNAACQLALDFGFEYLFFFDSDVVAPPDTIHRLLSYNVPIISGVYHRRSEPVGIPVAIRNREWTDIQPNTGVQEVDNIGAGCMMIRRDVLQRFQPQRPGKHWFDWRVDMNGAAEYYNDSNSLSEDFTFCKAAKEQGIPVLVDTTIQCQHIGWFAVEYKSIKPTHI